MSLLNRVNRVLGQTRAERNGTSWPLGLVAFNAPKASRIDLLSGMSTAQTSMRFE